MKVTLGSLLIMNKRNTSLGIGPRGSKITEASIGLTLVFVGLLATWEASGFDSKSRVYPMIISGLLAVTGAAVVIGALFGEIKQQNISRSLRDSLPAVGVIGFWAIALESGLGFIFPTLVMQFMLMWMGGVQGTLRKLSYALLTTIGAYLMFAVVLNVQLPVFSLIDIF